MLRDGSTVIQLKGQTSRPVCISTGVKQDDPLSPLLFNIVLDELLDQLEEANRGYSWQQRDRSGPDNVMEPQLPVLAFADDIAVVAQSPTALNQQLRLCSTFLKQRSLRLNPNKCSVLLLVHRPHADSACVPLRDPLIFLRLGATLHPLPQLCSDRFYKYLGVYISPLNPTTFDMLKDFKKLADEQGFTVQLADEQGFTVQLEPMFHHNGQLLKPDLLMVGHDVAALIDVAIPWETASSFPSTRRRKIDKHAVLSDDVQLTHPGSRVIVEAIIAALVENGIGLMTEPLRTSVYR
uniref:Reverse transcriptase domain-containing protein n=1 Tax=Trichuris muris TaxID=70415 RepID=A0A5S6Q0A1_TRIMR